MFFSRCLPDNCVEYAEKLRYFRCDFCFGASPNWQRAKDGDSALLDGKAQKQSRLPPWFGEDGVKGLAGVQISRGYFDSDCFGLGFPALN